MKSTDEPINLEFQLKASVTAVWKALTDLREMKEWYFQQIDSFVPEVGFETKFTVELEDRKFTHLWKITEVIPFQKISYDWKYKEYPGDSNITFELIENSGLSSLKLSMVVLEDFPDDIPEFKRESGIVGWNYFIGKALKEYVESN